MIFYCTRKSPTVDMKGVRLWVISSPQSLASLMESIRRAQGTSAGVYPQMLKFEGPFAGMEDMLARLGNLYIVGVDPSGVYATVSWDEALAQITSGRGTKGTPQENSPAGNSYAGKALPKKEDLEGLEIIHNPNPSNEIPELVSEIKSSLVRPAPDDGDTIGMTPINQHDSTHGTSLISALKARDNGSADVNSAPSDQLTDDLPPEEERGPDEKQ